MSKKIFFIIIIFLLIFTLVGCNFNNDNNSNNSLDVQSQESTNSDYSAQKTESTTNNSTIEITKNATTPSEEEISNFSTKIYTKDSARQNNLTITCKALDGTEVKPGETFSFCNTVGKATTARGYQKADIFTADGKKTKGLGGGNCQISSTLYNAVLQVNGLTVTERHAHSNYVPYIQKGKDAAVAYGGYDLKFVNNLDKTVKIKAGNSKDNVTITLLALNS